MALVKAHIGLKAEDPQGKAESVEKLLKAYPISDINQDNLHELGVVRVMVDKSHLDEINNEPYVSSVEEVGKKGVR